MADTVKSTDVSTVHGQVVVNPDGTNVGGSVSLAKDDLPISSASQAVGVAIVDGSGNQITSFGGGTQYTEGDTDATIVGTAIMFETNTGTNAIGVVNASNPLPVSASIDTTGLATTTTDTNTTTIAGAVSGGEMQVSITSEGALSVETTQQSVLGEVSDINYNTASIDTKTPALGQALAAGSVPVVLTAAQLTTITPPAAITGFATSANQTTIIGHVDGLEGLLTTIDADTGNIATEVAALLTDTELRATPVPVSGTVAVTGVSTLAEQQSQTTHLATIAGDTTSIQTAIELIDNAVDGNYLNTNMNIAGTDAVSGSGTATGALRVELPTNGTGVIATVGAVTAITNALPAGTAEIGSLLPPDTDVTAHTNYARKYYTNAGAVTDGIIWSPAAGKRWHVVTMYIQTSAASTITLEDDKSGGDDPVWKGEIAANSGVTLSFTEQYPMASGEDAADLIITTTAGNVYVTCVGYEI